MSERLKENLTEIINNTSVNDEIDKEFIRRINENFLTREENPLSHFAVFFIAIDSSVKEVYLGHHKKADLWLCHGGHIEKDEIPPETLTRETGEEWGIIIKNIGHPMLVNITEIDNRRQLCKRHFNIWYFLQVDKNAFSPDHDLELTEFYEARWVDLTEARQLVTDRCVLEAIDFIERVYFRKTV
jgi:8-oxo-dGTP pyrophosphatase MutT (NUDIX family)